MGESEHPKHVTLGHDVLFADTNDTRGADRSADEEARCDVCDGLVVDDDADEGPAIPGRAYYVWTRGDVQRREEAPICASCAVALGMSALGRWEIEEEEG